MINSIIPTLCETRNSGIEIAIDPKAGTIFAGTSGGGIFKREIKKPSISSKASDSIQKPAVPKQ